MKKVVMIKFNFIVNKLRNETILLHWILKYLITINNYIIISKENQAL